MNAVELGSLRQNPREGIRVIPPAPQHALRIWLLTNAPSPYQSELLSAIADRDDVELDVRFLESGSPAGRASEVRYCSRVMWSVTPRFLPEELRLCPRALWECACGRYDCYVLSGLYTSVSFLACAMLLSLRRRPWGVWFERPRAVARRRASWSPRWLMSRPVRWLRDRVQAAVLGSTHQVIGIGSAAVEEYAGRGVPKHLLAMVPYCCDNERFALVDAEEVAAVQRGYQLDGRVVFLFSGRMIERKGVDIVIAAFERVAGIYPDAVLLLIGDGPRRASYEASVAAALRARVRFAGHVPQRDLPAIFAAADVFVFPSRHDGWGVVINEACAAGLPIIVTQQTGAARDLVEHEKSGYILEQDDVEGFARAMRHFMDHPEDRAAFGARSRELVERFSPEQGAARFREALAATCCH